MSEWVSEGGCELVSVCVFGRSESFIKRGGGKQRLG